MRIASVPLLSLLALSLTFAGCSKDKKDEPSTTALLTNKNWVLTAQTVDPPLPVLGTNVTDLYAQLDACDKDDILRFTTPNVYTNDEGGSKCSPGAPQTTTGTWVLSSDQKTITVTETGDVMSLTILSLTSSEMKVKAPLSDRGLIYNVTLTYAAR